MDSLSVSKRDRPVQIVITEDMRAAGVEAFCELPFGSSADEVIERVWLAMVSEVPSFQK